MTNKETVSKFIENLITDHDKAAETFAENIRAEWPGSGMEPIVGREKLLKFFAENGHNEIISQKIETLIAEGDKVSGTGSVVSEKDGKKTTSHFADFYILKDGKIVDLKSFVIMDKQK